MTEVLKGVSDYLAQRKGLPVLIGVGLMIISLIFNLLPAWPVLGWLAKTDFFFIWGQSWAYSVSCWVMHCNNTKQTAR